MSFSRFCLRKLGRLRRAEYWWQPLQLPRRALRQLRRWHSPERLLIDLPWQHPIEVDPREAIGRALVALNVLDLPVAESLWRLLDEGETAIDVGANIGTMTSLLGARLKSGGDVWAFEPLPPLAVALAGNVARWQRHSLARVHLSTKAVSDQEGQAPIFVPGNFADNHGVATLSMEVAQTDQPSFQVTTCTLDGEFPALPAIGLLKIDVEGCEASVLRGASKMFTQRTIRDVVFEEWAPYPAESHQVMQRFGYVLFRIGRSFARPLLLPADSPESDELDPPAYLATIDPERARRRLASLGWRCLRP